MGARRKPQGSRKPEVVDNSLKGMRDAARAEANGGTLPAPSMTIAASGTSRKRTDKRNGRTRDSNSGHGKHK